MKKKKYSNILDLLASVIFLILWLTTWYSYMHYGGEILKVCALFTAFVVLFIGAILDRIKKKIRVGIWGRCIIHCLISGIICTFYIFQVSNKPLFDSIILGLWFGFGLLIQYSWENNQYYNE